MKKNRMMRLASLLLVLTLATTSILSGTFAKYVTTGEVSDSARVAKFGVEVSASGNLFSSTYYSTNGTSTSSGAGDTITVQGEENAKVVAPGTTNTGSLNFGITGTPEVKVKVSLSMEETSRIFLAKNTYTDVTGAGTSFDLSNDYYPIVWTLKNSTGVVNNLEDTTLANINTYLSSQEFTFDAGTNLSTQSTLSNYSLTWKWAFSDTTSSAGANVDKADTVLGDLAAGGDFLTKIKKGATLSNALTGEDYKLDEAVKITITVTQVD